MKLAASVESVSEVLISHIFSA